MALQFFSSKNGFRERILAGEFTLSVEASPPRGFVTGALLRKLEALVGQVDAVCVTDCAMSRVAMGSFFFCHQIQRQVGLTTIAHLTCRDRNSLALQADLLGAYSIGVENFLVMKGDPVSVGPEKQARGVFHHSTITLLDLFDRLNKGKTEGGQPLKTPPDLFFGAVTNPSVPNQRTEAKRVAEKIEAGARFIFTQPVFDHRIMRSFISYLAEYQALGKVPIIMGIMPIRSLEDAQSLAQNVPGLFVPAEVIIKFQKKDTPETGLAICRKICEDLRGLIQGLHLFGRGSFEGITPFLDLKNNGAAPLTPRSAAPPAG